MTNKKKSKIDSNEDNAIRKIWCSKCDTVFYTYVNDRSDIRCPSCRASVYNEGENVE